MHPLKTLANMPIIVRCAVLSIAVAALCALIVLSPQPQVATTPVVASLVREPMRWHMDPYMSIRVNTQDFSYEIDKLAAHGPVHLSYQFVTWPTVKANDPIGDRLFVIRVLHDSTDLANHVENFFVDEVMANDPRAQLMHVVKTGKSTWITTVGVAATKQIALMDLPNMAQSELHLQGKLSLDISTATYDSVTIKVNGVELARVDAAYSRPILHMPAACLKDGAAAKANYVMVFGNDFGYVAVAKSLDGFRGTIPGDIQLCWINGQVSALKALNQVAAEFAGMATGNKVVWHEGTKATVLSADFTSPPARPNHNQ